MAILEQSLSRPRGRSAENPFDLNDADAYSRWRDSKLSNYPSQASDMIVEIGELANPSEGERAEIIQHCQRANLAIYASGTGDGDESAIRAALPKFTGAFGLRGLESHRSAADDGIVAVEVADEGKRGGYIPYTNRPLTWHTDGYYNAPRDRIRAFLLHCVRDAGEGGENSLLDPQIAYIRLRDENPQFIAALTHADAMTIPENREASGKLRPVSRGPVFSIDPETRSLQMRYSARGRNIVWREDADTQAATRFLADLLAGGEPLILKVKLAPGQGLICNNVLHCRSGFDDAVASVRTGKRLLYRMRYRDRISATRGMASMNHSQ